MIRDIFVIEDNPGDALLVKEYLKGSDRMKFNFEFFDSVQKVETEGKNFNPAVILLDLYLTDSKGISTFEKVYKLYKHVPIIILSGYDDEETAFNAVKNGAQDYLIKGKINEKVLQIAVLYAIERVKLLHSLFSSEQKFKLLTENAPIFIWMTDSKGRFIYCNKLLSNFLCISVGELCNKSMIDFVSPQSYNNVSLVYDNAFSLSEPYSIEYELKNGFSVYEKAVPYKDENCSFLGFISTGLDLSEIKRVEKEKNLNKEKYEFIAENSLDVIWKMDLNLNTIYCNKAIQAFVGYLPSEFTKLTPEDYLTEESLLLVKKELTKKLYKYEESNNLDITIVEHLDLDFIHKNGEIKHGEINARLTYDFNTDNIVIMGVTRDKTEKQKTDEKIRNYQNKVEILASSAISFLEYQEKANIFCLIGENLLSLIPHSYILVSSVKGEISTLEYIAGLGTQIKSLDKLIGSTIIGRKTKLNTLALQRLGKGKIIKVDGGLYEVTLNTISHNIIDLLERAFNVSSVYVFGMNKDSNLLGSVIVIMKKGYEPDDFDIIDAYVNQATIALNRKNAEESLIKSEQQLRDSNAAKDKFFSIISHDLRSPFQGILGYFDILTENFEDVSREELFKILSNLKSLVHNQYNLLENLLTWASIQRGKKRIDKQQLKLTDLVDWIVGALSINATKKEINITKDIPENFIIDADVEMLKSILNNLISNSIKFTPRGGLLSMHTIDKKGNKLLIIEDNGVGMSEVEVENLFKIDKQNSKLGTEKEKGTGLGLILCKEFIDMHGWTIKVESKVGIGTKFIIGIEQKIY